MDNSLPVNAQQGPAVPVFNCVIYVAEVDGKVAARVANLPGIQIEAASQREAMAQIVPAFKARLQELLEGGEEIPWQDPPDAIQPTERQFLVAVHL